jgi:hypothetical protein
MKGSKPREEAGVLYFPANLVSISNILSTLSDDRDSWSDAE